jgi:hypothetical protein
MYREEIMCIPNLTQLSIPSTINNGSEIRRQKFSSAAKATVQAVQTDRQTDLHRDLITTRQQTAFHIQCNISCDLGLTHVSVGRIWR